MLGFDLGQSQSRSMLTSAVVGVGVSVLAMMGHTQVAAADPAAGSAARVECILQVVVTPTESYDKCSDYCSTCESCMCCEPGEMNL